MQKDKTVPNIDLIERKLAEEPIELPSSPFWNVFREFGRDELIALIINTVGTIGIARLTGNPFLLSISGPVIEKIGFFLAYFKEAWNIYSTTPQKQREGLFNYIARAFKRGFVSLGKDIAVHDPLYTLLMYAGLKTYSGTPVWMLSTLSFLLAVGVVAVGEVAVNEARFRNRALRFKKRGFGRETYLESRFYIKGGNAGQILDDLSAQFNLKTKKHAEYHDRYFENNLSSYNSRKPILRFRQRGKEEDLMQTVQIVYTRASEMARKNPTQFNYYPTEKDKFYFELKQDMIWDPAEIEDEKLKKFCQKICNGKFRDVFFTRNVTYNLNDILVSIDQVNSQGTNPFTVVEIKAYKDEKRRKAFVEAMRFVMLKYEVVQTTLTKSVLSALESA